MKVVILSLGTIGDIVPYTGVAARLETSGHKVVFAAEESFRPAVEESGFELRSIPINVPDLLAASPAQGRRKDRRGIRYVRKYMQALRTVSDAMIDACDGMVEAVGGADVLLVSYGAAVQGYLIAKSLGIPSMGLFLFPMTPTRDFPPALLGDRSFGPIGNKLAGPIGLFPVSAASRWTKEFCRRLRLPPATMAAVNRDMAATNWPIRYGFSPTVVPRPVDWPDHVEVVGYWWPQPRGSWQPSPALVDFLSDGPAPVLITLGSLGSDENGWMSEIFVQAIRQAGVRAVVQAGAARLRGAADHDMMTSGDVSHEWLLPQTAAVVHRAGAGTTAAALRAGIPAVPVPVSFDNSFWAGRLVRLGVSPGGIPAKRLAAEPLSQLIEKAANDAS
ncbi:MAG: glycosyltransferase family 1 protein, partial [Kutzneria sp.]|nr:glycosyltransferase family 1 protein [Kutzneria sp.]